MFKAYLVNFNENKCCSCRNSLAGDMACLFDIIYDRVLSRQQDLSKRFCNREFYEHRIEGMVLNAASVH